VTTLYQCVVCQYVHQVEPEGECDGCDRNPELTFKEFVPKPEHAFTDFLIIREEGKQPRIGKLPVDLDKAAQHLAQVYEALPEATTAAVTTWADGRQQEVESGRKWLSMHADNIKAL